MKPRNFWYTAVKKMIMSTDELKENDSEKSREILRAIEEAKAKTSLLDNGELRIRAVESVLINKNKNYLALEHELHYEHHTIIQWVSDFVNLVGMIYGYRDKKD